MKLFMVTTSLLVGLTAAGGSSGSQDHRIMKNWMMMRAEESCWGKENVKIWTVKMKRAVQECSEMEAPELDLAPFRQPYRFINTLMNYADKTEDRQAALVYKILRRMYNPSNYFDNHYNEQHYYNDNYESEPQFYNHNNNRKMEDMVRRIVMKTMNKKDDSMDYNTNARTSLYRDDVSSRHSNKNFFRNQYNKKDMYRGDYSSNKYSSEVMYDAVKEAMREKEMKDNMMKYKVEHEQRMVSPFMNDDFSEKMAALLNRRQRSAFRGEVTNPLDVGDRLIERVESIQRGVETKIGNLTCILRKFDVINEDNELDETLMRNSMEEYSMPDPWFKRRVMADQDMCNKVAQALPSEAMDHTSNIKGYANIPRIKAFMKCHKAASMRTCIAKDMRQKLKSLEASVGKLEDISKATNMSEDEILHSMAKILYNESHDDEF